MRIAILGTGHMGRTLGTSLISAGHDVVFGSREPGSATDLPAPAVGHTEAIAASDVVVSALAADHSLATLTPLGEALADRVLIDIGNAVNQEMDLIYPDSSLGERLQRALPNVRVVKTLNTLAGAIGANPTLLPAPTNVFLSGDDAAAKSVVAGLLTDLGWAASQQIDLGAITTARAVEHYFLLFAALMGALHTPMFNLAIASAPATQENTP
ncbi:NADPH-dependent F420 reductase [Solicola gregarius]|uniref:NAD(P)-binding domain-containing protein n=1 Tax=Solicola gregarius TaxID=2908642 RepID=A0AA46YML0_9ACTN|nr:NAD(P)-binding domain-containing protein [Solicola gregarius]UYM05848.1 NAD(P)-binding domain-containing protein [Solicola gregarius]